MSPAAARAFHSARSSSLHFLTVSDIRYIQVCSDRCKAGRCPPNGGTLNAVETLCAKKRSSTVSTTKALKSLRSEIPVSSREATSAWFQMFKKFGSSPSPAAFLELFHPNVVVVDSGLRLSYSGEKVELSISKLLAAMPDLKIEPVRHCARNNSIFIETKSTGTLNGEKVSWGTCYGVTLTGHLASRFRIYADHTDILKPLLKNAPVFPAYQEVWDEEMVGTHAIPFGRPDAARFVDAYQAVWRNPSPMGFANCYTPDGTIVNPGMPRPITKPEIPGYYAWLLRRIPDLEMALVDWAGDENIAYAEWVGTGTLADAPFSTRVIDVFHFDDRGVYYGQAYFDTLKTIARLDPSVLKHREMLFVSAI